MFIMGRFFLLFIRVSGFFFSILFLRLVGVSLFRVVWEFGFEF